MIFAPAKQKKSPLFVLQTIMIITIQRVAFCVTTVGGVEVIDIETERDLRVRSEEHAQNLIKALNKAIALGWFDE